MKRFDFFLSAIAFLTLAAGCTNSPDEPQSSAKPPLFTLMTPEHTGIHFSNILSEGPNTNILMYEYFYNGGGVGAGDLNGDSLIDLYFTSNMHENRLYLNRGGLRFTDITKLTGAEGRNGPWKTGVTMADVNGDGLLDIYLSYSGMVRDENRQNQLFINQGNDENNVPKFIESAAAYGLASAAWTTQAYFFDYDRDGDLDALLLNHNPVNLPILNEASTASLLKKDDPLRGVRLLRQTNGKFTDVTTRAGINGSELTYGLGAGIADINDDGWPDLYISNDYAVPDYLYINNRDGSFTNRINDALGHISQFSMGNDVADVNNDGLPDIITLDMLPEDNRRQKLLMSPDNYAKFDLNVRSGFHYQYMRNMLQINNGNGTFSEIGQLAGISNTDWSWAPLAADYDNDGLKDLFVTNGYLRDYTNLDFIRYMEDFVKEKKRLKREDVLEIIRHMPSTNVTNYIFSNNDGLTFSNRTKEWGMERPSNSNGAAYADLDNDGDLDLVVNNINDKAFVFRNNADTLPNHYLNVTLAGGQTNRYGIGSTVTIWANGKKQSVTQMPCRGYQSSVTPVLHFGLGQAKIVDSLLIRWNSGEKQKVVSIAADRTITLREEQAVKSTRVANNTPVLFTETDCPIRRDNVVLEINDFKRQPLLPSQLSHTGTIMRKGDVNGDGREDLFVGGGNGIAAQLLVQTTAGNFEPSSEMELARDRNIVDTDAAFLDANGDGFTDLYVTSGGYHQLQKGDPRLRDRLYLNDGRGQLKKVENFLPAMAVSNGCVVTADFNGDGRDDLFAGGRLVPGRYPETPESFLLISKGDAFEDRTDQLAPNLRHLGMVTDAVATDLNHDGRQDLVVAGEWMPLSVFINTGQGFEDKTLEYFDKQYSGWWNTIETGDFNNDGIIDLIAGNAGLNQQCKASDGRPAEMVFADFDNNGSVDPFLCFYIQGKSYPYLTRDELLEQIGSLRSRFRDYAGYADATLTDIIQPRELEKAQRLYANHLETSLFLGSSTGRFTRHALPAEAQFSPVYSIAIFDFNGDGNEDLLLNGNNSYNRIKTGKNDACYGTLLQGNGTGTFSYIPQHVSGFRVRGDVRSVVAVDDVLLFGISGRPIVAYKRNGAVDSGHLIAKSTNRRHP